MIARLAFAAMSILAAWGHSGTQAQSRPDEPLLGRWDLVVQRGTQTMPSWLEVERSGGESLPFGEGGRSTGR